MTIRPVPITVFGEVLFDCFPDGSEVLGGAPFNVAWHLRGFGLSPCLISRIGTDNRGERIRSAMRRWGLDDACLQQDADHPSGSVEVVIENDQPGYRIVPGSAYDFIESGDAGSLPEATILYHGTLALRCSVSAAALADLKASHTGKIFLDVNLRAPWWTRERLEPLLADAHHVKLNENELTLLASSVPATAGMDAPEAVMEAFSTHHGLESLIVTRGSRGALFWSEGVLTSVSPASGITVVDTVGAGDGFASAMLLGFSQGWSPQVSLERARDFASALVARRGATIDDRSVYREFLRAWCQS